MFVPEGREATVTVGERSDRYLLALCDGSDPRAVAADRPERVAALIVAAAEKATA